MPKKTGIAWTKTLKLKVLTRAREIITDPQNWTRARLRAENGHHRYCVLGACEQAVYDLKLGRPGKHAFTVGAVKNGYKVGEEISLFDYCVKEYGMNPYELNDRRGYETVMEALDGYIATFTTKKKA